MLLSFRKYYINGVFLLNNLHAYSIGRIGGTNICLLISIKRGWQCKAGESDFYTLSVQIPQKFQIVLFHIEMLTTNNIKHLFNLSAYGTVSEKNT